MSGITLLFQDRRGRRNGTAVLFSPEKGNWYLVPSYFNGMSTSYSWDEKVPTPFGTKKAASEYRKYLRSKGKLP